MGKRQRRSSKKKEPFFNFAKLRSSLSSQEKEKLIRFFTGFRTVFKELQGNLFKLNQKFDTMEYQVKNFQQNYLKNINDKPQEEEFVLNENDIQELLGAEEKKKNEVDNFFDKEEEEEPNEVKKDEITGGNNYSEKLFDFNALVKKSPTIDNHTNVLVPDTFQPQKNSEGGWINKN